MAVEHRDRRRLAHLGDKFLQVRRCNLRHAEAGQVGVAEFQHARPERELPAVVAHVAELDQGEQEPARRRPRQAGGPGDLAEAEPLSVRSECLDHRQPAIEGLHEVAVPSLAATRPRGHGRRRQPPAAQRQPGVFALARGSCHRTHASAKCTGQRYGRRQHAGARRAPRSLVRALTRWRGGPRRESRQVARRKCPARSPRPCSGGVAGSSAPASTSVGAVMAARLARWSMPRSPCSRPRSRLDLSARTRPGTHRRRRAPARRTRA